MAARQAERLIPDLAEFEGLWRLERDIAHEGAAPARFEGEARFDRDGADWRYREAGVLQVHGQVPMQAERAYVWRPRAEGGIDVFFEDGRFFHAITGAAQAKHWCAPDMYEVTYAFHAWPEWTATWQVRGPKKAYRMVSVYSRSV